MRPVPPFMYSMILWALLSRVVLFGDVPKALVIAGMAVIMAAALQVIHFDNRQTAIPVI